MLLPCSVVSHRAITCYCPALGLLQSIMAYIAQSVPLIVWLQGLQISVNKYTRLTTFVYTSKHMYTQVYVGIHTYVHVYTDTHKYRNSLFFVVKIFSYRENVRKFFTRIFYNETFSDEYLGQVRT